MMITTFPASKEVSEKPQYDNKANSSSNDFEHEHGRQREVLWFHNTCQGAREEDEYLQSHGDISRIAGLVQDQTLQEQVLGRDRDYVPCSHGQSEGGHMETFRVVTEVDVLRQMEA